jgi:predicted ATP-binding protein involved in virulence
MNEQLEYSILLKRLKLINFRCFDELTIDFDEKLTVFIAENGGGKTAILEALAEGLKAYLAAFKLKGYEKSDLNPKSIRKGSEVCDIAVYAAATHIWPEEEVKERGEEIVSAEWDFKTEDIRLDVSLRPSGGRFLPDTKTSFFRDSIHFRNANRIANLPVMAYYGGDSVSVAYNSKTKIPNTRLDLLYKDSLSASRFHFTPFYNWYKEREDKMFRIGDKEDPEYKTNENQLKKIKNAIERVLNDDIDNPVYTNLRLDKNLDMGMTKKRPDGGIQFIEIGQFSAGEKALFAFVADLGMRLLQARLDEDFTELEGTGSIRGRGIALIDEVDLHLHPTWQRKVVGKLMEIFPEVQWVLTTHSPEVLKGIDRERLRWLRNGKIVQSPFIKGRDANSILGDAFGLEERFPEDVKKLSEFYNLIETDKTKARVILDELKQDWGEMDEEIVRAESYLEIF